MNLLFSAPYIFTDGRVTTMYIDRLVLVFLAGAYLLSPSTIEWWSLGGSAWERPFLIWFLLILLSFWISKNRDHHDL